MPENKPYTYPSRNQEKTHNMTMESERKKEKTQKKSGDVPFLQPLQKVNQPCSFCKRKYSVLPDVANMKHVCK
ncbi:MAG: hypothetical protein AB1798_22925 [Spirochaetota bacterium]